MLVDGQRPVQLIGYLSALDAQPGFVVPLFRGRDSNMALVQEIGPHDRVLAFREVEPQRINLVEGAPHVLSLGDAGLWGFRDEHGSATFGDREVLRQYLLPRLRTVAQPFLKLQIADFCERGEELIAAWREAFDHLAQRSPRSADAWRDVVVIPAQVRLAVEHAVLSHGLDASVDRLNRTVEVEIVNGRLRLWLDAGLYAAFAASPAARSTLERGSIPIREAFQLAPNRLALLTQKETPEEAQDESDLNEIAIAAIGEMALSLLGNVRPRIKRSHGDYSRSYPLPRREAETVLMQGPAHLDASAWDQVAPWGGLDPHNRITFVVFQLSGAHSETTDRALEFARSHLRKRRTLIAVIPHLPQELDGEPSLSDMITALHGVFDAVWFLSDRSPHTRHGLPFGPARSIVAATSHFRYLLTLGRQIESYPELVGRLSDPATISVVGSAVGDQSNATLANYAMMRLSHHLFDFQSVASASVTIDQRTAAFDDVIEEIISSEVPAAKVTVSAPQTGRDGGPTRVIVALRGVRVLSEGAGTFEQYCLSQLERFGWSFQPGRSYEGDLIASFRDMHNIIIHLKHVREPSLKTALKTRPRRRRLSDDLLLTNAGISRRIFASHVLNGVVPVHASRIEVLHRIFSRRFDYTLTYLRKERLGAKRMLIAAALDWLTISQGLDARKLGNATLAPDAEAEIDFLTYHITLALPVLFTHGKDTAVRTVAGLADLRFDGSGWHLEHLAFD